MDKWQRYELESGAELNAILQDQWKKKLVAMFICRHCNLTKNILVMFAFISNN